MVVAAGFCLSFLMGTLMNLLFIPGFEHHGERVHRHHQHEKQQQPQQQQPDADSPARLQIEDLTPSAGRLPELQRQIRERLDEVLRYRQRRAHWVGTGALERRRLMDLEQRGEWESYKGIEKNNNYDQSRAVSIATKSVLGCGSIDNVTDVQYLGSGYTKAVYKAGYKLASFKIVKEMTLMERLQHPNILKVMWILF